MKPTIEELINEGQPIDIIDADDNMDLAEGYGIMSLPTLVAGDEHEVNTLSGMKTKEEVLEFIKNNTKL
jgi:CO dehydrogenase nickel-insertion accessory protein CooC1